MYFFVIAYLLLLKSRVICMFDGGMFSHRSEVLRLSWEHLTRALNELERSGSPLVDYNLKMARALLNTEKFNSPRTPGSVVTSLINLRIGDYDERVIIHKLNTLINQLKHA